MPQIREDAMYIDPRLISVPPQPSSRSKSNSRITRPPNAFIIFRSEMISKLKLKDIETDQRNISRIVGHLWNDLPEDQKENYRQAAEIRRLQHQLEHPDYKYQPYPATESPKEKRRRHGVEDEVARACKVADKIKRSAEYQYSSVCRAPQVWQEGASTHATSARTAYSHYPSAPLYPSSSTSHPTASYYPSASTATSSNCAYPAAASQHSSSPGYVEYCHQYQQDADNNDPTEPQLCSSMGHADY